MQRQAVSVQWLQQDGLTAQIKEIAALDYVLGFFLKFNQIKQGSLI